MNRKSTATATDETVSCLPMMEEAVFFVPETCGWCNPENKSARFSVAFWVKTTKRWHSMTQVIKPQYCPMCGRKLEVEG